MHHVIPITVSFLRLFPAHSHVVTLLLFALKEALEIAAIGCYFSYLYIAMGIHVRGHVGGKSLSLSSLPTYMSFTTKP